MDLIDRQAAIDAVSYAMKNGGDWRPALEAVPAYELPSFRGGKIPGGGNGCQGPYLTQYCSALSDDEVKQPCIEGPCGFECEKEDDNGQL